MSGAYQIESELMTPPPRRIQRRAGNRMFLTLGCFQLFLLPFIAVGLYMFLGTCYKSLVMGFGTVIFGQVVDRSHVIDDDGSSDHIRYQYWFGGMVYSAEADVDPTDAVNLRTGSTVRVKILTARPGRGSILLIGSDPANLVFFWVWVIGWNGIFSIFLWVLFVVPYKLRAAFVRGRVATGTIIAKTSSSDEGETKHSLNYEFSPEDIGPRSQQTIQGSESVPKQDWESVQVGEQMTVLYLPEKPRYNSLYRFGPYRVQ